jgi:hypothetical protein
VETKTELVTAEAVTIVSARAVVVLILGKIMRGIIAEV